MAPTYAVYALPTGKAAVDACLQLSARTHAQISTPDHRQAEPLFPKITVVPRFACPDDLLPHLIGALGRARAAAGDEVPMSFRKQLVFAPNGIFGMLTPNAVLHAMATLFANTLKSLGVKTAPPDASTYHVILYAASLTESPHSDSPTMVPNSNHNNNNGQPNSVSPLDLAVNHIPVEMGDTRISVIGPTNKRSIERRMVDTYHSLGEGFDMEALHETRWELVLFQTEVVQKPVMDLAELVATTDSSPQAVWRVVASWPLWRRSRSVLGEPSKSGFAEQFSWPPVPYTLDTCRSVCFGGANGVQGGLKFPRLILAGSGTSSGCPLASCLANPNEQTLCASCLSGAQHGSPDRRQNTCAVIQFLDTNNKVRSIMIDCGKLFHTMALDVFARYNIQDIDAIILTHDHFDAVGGLDCLRDITSRTSNKIPIYVSERERAAVTRVFPYLVNTNLSTGGGSVSSLDFVTFNVSKPLSIQGVEIMPIVVDHGSRYKCLGFRFGNCCYLSDVNGVKESALDVIDGCEVLIVDALDPAGFHPSHFCLPQCLHFLTLLRFKPKQVVLTDMSHHWTHSESRAVIDEALLNARVDSTLRNVKITLGFDGQCIDIKLPRARA